MNAGRGMMPLIEAILYIAAGFFTALFLAMAVAPAIWRRAGYLTRKRIEAAVPLSVNELQADKDRIRAEYAVRESRLERSLSKQRDKVTGQATRIARMQDEIEALKGAVADRDGTVSALEADLAQARDELQQRASEIEMMRVELGASSAALAARTGELEGVTRMRADAENNLARVGASLEENSRVTQSLEARLGDTREKLRQQQAAVRKNRTEARQAAELLKTERSKAEDLDTKLQKAIARASDLEDKLLRRETEIGRLRDDKLDERGGLAELERRAEDAEQDRKASEDELAEMTVRMSRIEKLLGGRDPETALAARDAKIAQLETELKRGAAIGATIAVAATGGQKDEPEGDAALREAIADLAARLVHMATVLEGEGSPVPALVADAEDLHGTRSLAARIRALQQEAGIVLTDTADASGKEHVEPAEPVSS